MNHTSRKAVLSLLTSGKNRCLSLRRRLHLTASHQHAQATSEAPNLTKPSLRTLGQPTHLTHPHRIEKGELVPGITLDEIKLRRSKLVESMKNFCFQNGFLDKTLVIIIPSSHKKYMTEKIPYVFRQNSDFLYLTGCLEPDCVLVLICKNSSDESVLFVRERDPQSELWDGPRTGVDEAVTLFGVNKSLPVRDFQKFIQSFIKDHPDCMLWYDYINDIHPNIHNIMQQFLSNSQKKVWETPKPFIHQLRLFKSDAEQKLMKKSCLIASGAIEKTIQSSEPGDSEARIQARVDYNCRMEGAEYLAYPPVVASGERANIIHYINNDQIVKDGELVLMDAGCEYHGYSSDITRTWPISGKFTPVQRSLYEVVYSVQADLIQMCSEFPTLDELFEKMGQLLAVRLKSIGVISEKVNDDELKRCVFALCPHHVSHYLGMDVHDTSLVPRKIHLKPGMIITIEPGVYVNKNNVHVNPDFHNLGIRIEDDVLITDSGPYVLTSSCPKHPDDIENLRRS